MSIVPLEPGEGKPFDGDAPKIVPCVVCSEPAQRVGYVGRKPRYRCSECQIWFDRPTDSAKADGRKDGGA